MVVHRLRGSDAEKVAHLQANVASDHHRAFSGRLVDPISVERYQAMLRLGTASKLFGQLLDYVHAPTEPVMCITQIVDGKPFVDAVVQGNGVINLSLLPDGTTGAGKMEDYLAKYMTGDSFDLPRLINDDYFVVIKLLFNNKNYVSVTKLLMSFLDTVAFIESGNVRGNFIPWLKCYADLEIVGITEEELWELRNGLLHMTNPDSQKVLKGHHARLVPYVAVHDMPPSTDRESKPFNLLRLLEVITKALEAWFVTYRVTPSKMVDFVLRYDKVVSDSRFAFIVQNVDEGRLCSPE